MESVSLMWFRRDLRRDDNLAFIEAGQHGAILPIYIFEDKLKLGAASKVWLHNSLSALNSSLESSLQCYYGDTVMVIKMLLKKYDIRAVFWNKVYEPDELRLEEQVVCVLKELNIKFSPFNSNLLWDPAAILNKEGDYYKVYTAFLRNVLSVDKAPRFDMSYSEKLSFHHQDNNTKIEDLRLLPESDWYKKIKKIWSFGEKEAEDKLKKFIRNIKGYAKGRDYPSKAVTSFLSPHLHFGEISPNKVWWAVVDSGAPKEDIDVFCRELVWREFSYYILYYFPTLNSKNYQKKFDGFLWENNDELLNSWKEGRTGYPIIDAGMRELWQTGYMHNRVRMIVASFLVKNLLIDWRLGADWFMEYLLDADLANNSNNWQWVAGSGVDHAPYFRIFNPILQAKKFDSDGKYIRQFVPELAKLPTQYLFDPSSAPEFELNKAGIKLGETYPKAIVDLVLTRKLALQRYNKIT